MRMRTDMDKKISVSIMCVDFFKLEESVKTLEEQGIDLIHVDIMDGSLVPNFTLGTDFVKALKANTTIPLDIHLMVENPENKLDWFEFGEGDYVSVHYETAKHLHKAITAIKAKGAKAMVAINPATPICVLDDILSDIDAVLIMTVNPGFAGQKLIPSTLTKIKKLREYLDSNGFNDIEIQVDGNVSFENAKLMNEAGANIFVAGTSSVFSKDNTVEENTKCLKNIINS